MNRCPNCNFPEFEIVCEVCDYVDYEIEEEAPLEFE